MFELYALDRGDCFVYWVFKRINDVSIPYMWIESSGKCGLTRHDSANRKVGISIRSDSKWEKIA